MENQLKDNSNENIDKDKDTMKQSLVNKIKEVELKKKLTFKKRRSKTFAVKK